MGVSVQSLKEAKSIFIIKTNKKLLKTFLVFALIENTNFILKNQQLL